MRHGRLVEDFSMFIPSNILVPTDFSNYSTCALNHAVQVAKQCRAKIHLLHVVDEGLWQCIVDCRLSNALMQKIEEENLKMSTEKLQQEAACISETNADVEILYNVKQGIPYYEIINVQEEKKIDLIVIASHGKTGLQKHLIGSVAEKVLRGAKCDVLLVRA
jgi:nucleotide-binding universal stress UspA family protein